VLPSDKETTTGDCLYVFQTNQRLRDNPSLQYAYLHYWKVVPVLVVPDQAHSYDYRSKQDMGVHRRRFLLESALALKEALKQKGVELILLRGNEQTNQRLKEICDAYELDEVITSYPKSTYEKERLAQLCKFAKVYTFEDHTLLAAEDLPFRNMPKSYSSFRKKVEAVLNVRDLTQNPVFNGFKNTAGLGDEFEAPLPTLSSKTAHPLHGGEAAAWERLNHYFWDSKALAQYKKTRNGMIGADYSSKFSAYLALGNLSPVQIHYAIKDFERQVEKNTSTYWLFFELLWREFFIWVTEKHGTAIFQLGGIKKRRDLNPSEDQAVFERWCNGETEHPFVNANMKELVETGYMSNRGRQNAASYLIHDLGMDWRWGAAFFEKHLVDYDVSSNWGNWMYIAGVGNSSRDVVFNVTKQQQHYDGQGDYVRLWNS
jgi:deoxyribodipyrimidine photo-lyase